MTDLEQGSDTAISTSATPDQPQPTPETSPETAPQQDVPEQQAAPEPKAPEKYEFQSPQGAEFDDKVLGVYSDVARELDLSQEDAQKLLDKVAPALQERALERQGMMRTEWADQARADQEIGGDAFDANLDVANQALARFASPDFINLLQESGLGNHPEMIRAWVKVGKAVSPDNFVAGLGTPPQRELTDAEVMYPDMAPK
jgi:hypothetical protein